VRLENNGVRPDVEVPHLLPYANGADPQFDRAVDQMVAVLGSPKGPQAPDG
jgi:C-terminal processing protease CtpA/Prc